ncbi:MAG: hypothetical protein FWE91_02260 [Defluviitaleaceae bacterium]|nr:hypothetical protein [Defluviitaleaceae bacterium]MCL2835130.1 hypothetical protein [Defluviitaleaceae bacterium]
MKKPDKTAVMRIAVLSALLIAAYIAFNRREEIFLRIINGISLAGIGNVLLGFGCMIRNSGQFRLLGYRGYANHTGELKKRVASGELPEDTDIPTFNEYSASKYEKKWRFLPFLIVGAPLTAAAVILSIIYM